MSAEEVIAGHWSISTERYGSREFDMCHCGWIRGDSDDWAAHVVTELAAAGYAIVHLPEPASVPLVEDGEDTGYHYWKWPECYVIPGDRLVVDDGIEYTPAQARCCAAALLAAANKAER